jgi:hypothetical protein
MTAKKIVSALVFVSLIACPAVAGTKSMKNTSTAANNCKAMVKAKKVSKADWQAELDKCLDNPTAYQ